MTVHGDSTDGTAAVSGTNTASIPSTPGNNIWPAAGVSGTATTNGTGVIGFSGSGIGVWGHSDTSTGTGGVSKSGHGLHGVSEKEHGVVGNSNANGAGVFAASAAGEGLHAETQSLTMAAIAGYIFDEHATGSAVYGKKTGTLGTAGYFDGSVVVTKDLNVVGNINVSGDLFLPAGAGDCAEEFDVASAGAAEPGTVMVLDDEGLLSQSTRAYDTRVIGVIPGAGAYRPGIVLDKQPDRADRKPIALIGKVFCKADAGPGPIKVGDLLTTSTLAGHAMKAAPTTESFGAVIGKALQPLQSGCALIPILVTLQ